MSNLFGALRDYTQGNINESQLNEYMTEPKEYEAREHLPYEDDPEFVAECNEACLPTFLMMELMENAYNIDLDMLDEDVKDSFVKIHDYMVGQGLITEATMNINNPKVTFVKLSKKAQIQRLSTIIALKMARKNNDPKYKKYKVASLLKRNCKDDIMKRYGQKANKLANKLWTQNKKNKKANAVVKEKATSGKAKK